MEYPAALMTVGSPKLQSLSETRDSIISSGIDPDSSPRSDFSTSSLDDEPPNYSPSISDETYDVDSLPEDDPSHLSSMEELNANISDSLSDHMLTQILSIRETHAMLQNLKRPGSMTLSCTSNQDINYIRHFSTDNPYPHKDMFQSCRDNTTITGYQPETQTNLIRDINPPSTPTENEIKPSFADYNTCKNKFKYASDENRNVEMDFNIVGGSYLRLNSENNNYIKFIDDPATDETDSSVEVHVITNPAFEKGGGDNGVKFKDEKHRVAGDSICSSVGSYNEEEDKKKSKAPDGGWGWVIVAASFIISMIADGISFSFGLLYIEFLRHFGGSSSQTSLVGSLFMAVPLLSGPIGSALVDRYGCRLMTMIGGFVAGLGFVVSAFANSLGMMYITFGLVAGVGLGLCYVTAVVSIAYWFDKRRTLATGLGACGTGFGTVLFAHLTNFFIQEYGWRGCTLLLAGTFFNMCVCGAVMRDPDWWIEQSRAASLAGTKSFRGASSCGSMRALDEDFPGIEELKRRLKCGDQTEFMVTNLATTTQTSVNGSSDGNQNYTFRSVVNLPTFIRQSERVPLEVLESLSANRRVFNVILENYPTLLLSRSASDGSKLNAVPMPETAPLRVPVTMSMRVAQTTRATPPMEIISSVSPNKSSTHQLLTINDHNTINNNVLCWHEDALPKDDKAGSDSKDSSRLNHKVDMFGCVIPKTPPQKGKSMFNKKNFDRENSTNILKKCVATVPSTHYLRNIRLHRHSLMYRGAMLNIHRYRLRASSCPDIYRNSMTTIAKENQEKWYADMIDLLSGMVDFSMFLDLHFLLMSIATILLFIWFIVPYFYLADHALLNKYSDAQVSSLLMIIGITNFFGMLGLGWAGDQPWMNVTKTYAICMVICGLATIAMPYFTYSYWLLACACACFGLFFSSSFSFTPVILAQLVPIERFATAYGLSLLCQGIGNLIGPPLAGWVFDVTRTYDMSFYIAGIWIIVAGVLLAIIPITKNRRIWGNGSIEKDKASLSDNRDNYA